MGDSCLRLAVVILLLLGHGFPQHLTSESINEFGDHSLFHTGFRLALLGSLNGLPRSGKNNGADDRT